MKLSEQRHGAVTVVNVDGALTGDDAETFSQRLMDALNERLGRVIVDASDIAYVDSRGLEALRDANEAMSQRGQALRLCGVNDTVRTALDITDLLEDFELYDEVNSAVRSFL
jgi:anti-anti-sigma factor